MNFIIYHVITIFRFLIPVVFYANVCGWVCQNTTARLLQDQPTQKKRPQSQRQNQHRNIRSAIQTFQHKKIQPGTPPIPNVSRLFSAVFYSNLNYIYKTLNSYLFRKIL